MKNQQEIEYISVQLAGLTFEVPDGSRYMQSKHNPGETEFDIFLPEGFPEIGIDIKAFDKTKPVKEMVEEKYAINNEMIPSPLNIEPEINDGGDYISCRYLFIDGLKEKRLVKLIGMILEYNNLLLTISADPEVFFEGQEIIDQVISSLENQDHS